MGTEGKFTESREVSDIVASILKDYNNGRTIDSMEDVFDRPDKDVIIDILDNLMEIIYPGYFRSSAYKGYNLNHHIAVTIEDVIYRLNKQIIKVSKFSPELKDLSYHETQAHAHDIIIEFLSRIPKIRDYLEGDLKATYDGDPAAYNYEEIILAYPGLYAITVNRIAHELFLLEVPLIPRIMTEHAHGLTGIDIHPGATIGRNFFIDHGTGIVVGETTIIGDNVKIYQGVTLGALSTRGGQRLRNVRRHPTIEDNVTIYAGASILGGETVIGRDSVIGSNAFITKSVAPGTAVSIKYQELQYKNVNDENSDWHTNSDNWFYVI